jgi:hypothetical protein
MGTRGNRQEGRIVWQQNFSRVVLIHTVLFVTGPQAASADQRTVPGTAEKAGEYPADYTGDDITRPESKFQLRLENKPSGTTTKIDTVTLYLQPEGVFDLDSIWGVSWQARLPLVSKPITTSGSSEASREFGVGDVEIQAVLFRPIDERWAYGFGARLVAPSASPEKLGNGKWQIEPIFGIRYSFLEYGSNTYFVPKIRYAESFGGDPSRRNISELQIAPTLNIGLPNRWFVTLFPSEDIRINFGGHESGQTGRLFFPFDALVGRKLTDNIVVSLEASVPIVKDYPVYNFRTELRVSMKF